MKKGIRTHDLGTKEITEIMSSCNEIGVTNLQLVLEKSVEGFEYGMYTDKYADELKERFKNINICVLGSYINPSSTDKNALDYDIKRFKEKILYAKVLNANVVGTETGFYGDEMSEAANNSEEAYQHLLKTMKELTEYAEEHGVNIAVEGVHCFVINTPQRLARLISDLNSPNVKAIFDPVNYLNIKNYQNQDKIINDMFDLLSDKIEIIHMKDFIVSDNEMRLTTPGDGILNYRLILERIKECNINPVFVSEDNNKENAKRGFKYLENI